MEPGPGHVPFVSIDLEQMVEAIGRAGAADYAAALFDRYLDWTKLDDLIEKELSTKSVDWSLKRRRRNAAPIFLPRAA